MNAAATTWVVLTWLKETTAARRARALALQRNTRPKSVAIRVGSGSSPHTSSHGQARRGDIFGDTARALDCKTLPKHEQRGSGTEQYRTVQSSLVLAWSSPPEPRTSTAHDMLALAETQGARATLRLAHRMESMRRYGLPTRCRLYPEAPECDADCP